MWFQWKGQGQIQCQIRRIVQKREIALLSFAILPKFTKMGLGIKYQSKLPNMYRLQLFYYFLLHRVFMVIFKMASRDPLSK